jgi:S1 RNA binding domain protein
MTQEENEQKVEVSDVVEQGNIIEVEVTNIADFGVFVRCANGEEGLIHISEVANEFVTNINKYVKLGEKVNVKVLGRNKKGKLEFSIKKVVETKPKKALFIRSSSENKEFEDVLNKFLKRSDEKQVDIRRNMKKKQGITKKKY